jgi:hypothetical protein
VNERVEHAARFDERENAYSILAEELQWKRLLGRPNCKSGIILK